jgi:hypothetical protein
MSRDTFKILSVIRAVIGVKVADDSLLVHSSEDLCVGLRTLTGVKALEVTESEEGGVRLLITIGECSFAMTLDSDKRICDIKVSISAARDY